MAKELVLTATTKLPAHLAQLQGVADIGDWESGTTGGFPVISTKGKVFHIRRGSETELVTNPEDPEEAATNLQLIVLKTHPGVAKTYYEGKYVEGSDDKPTCYSADGVAPAADAENRQAKKCAICPRNQWGSRVTEDGKQAKECSDVKRLAVAAAGQINDPMLIRVPPTSLKAWDNYVDMLAKRGLTPAHVITKISFDPTVAHQSLVLKVVNFITPEMVPQIEEVLQNTLLDNIIGLKGMMLPPAEEGDAADDGAADKPVDKPVDKPKRTRKPKAEAPPPPPDEEDDEEAAAIAALAAARAKKAAKAEKDAAAAKQASKPAKAAKAAPVEEEDEDEGGAFADIDFDDLDFTEEDED